MIVIVSSYSRLVIVMVMAMIVVVLRRRSKLVGRDPACHDQDLPGRRKKGLYCRYFRGNNLRTVSRDFYPAVFFLLTDPYRLLIDVKHFQTYCSFDFAIPGTATHCKNIIHWQYHLSQEYCSYHSLNTVTIIIYRWYYVLLTGGTL